MLTIAALVATCNRPELLESRSLPSIAQQTRTPNLIVVVDDSEESYSNANRQAVMELDCAGAEKVYIRNSRTSGASGAWNTGLAWLYRNAPGSFVAILDDDDAWASTYLEKCEDLVASDSLDMAVAGLTLYRHPQERGIRLSIPDALNAEDFLVGNPHIQGSNLFLRLKTLLESGGFDESFRSSTDRDLCIRLADLGYIRYGAVNEWLVHHYADLDRSRLSIPGSSAKRQGLTRFYRKYSARMNEAQVQAFRERAIERFQIDPVEASHTTTDRSKPPIPDSVSAWEPGADEELRLLIGIIASPDTRQVSRLLEDIREVFTGKRGVSAQAMILANVGQRRDSRMALKRIASHATELGLKTTLISVGGNRRERDSIAESRTALQRKLYLASKAHPGTVVWMLDDDVRLDGLVSDGNGAPLGIRPDYIERILELKRSGAPVVLGTVTGDPPIPFAASVRVQLVDLYHNLEWMSALDPDAPWPMRETENAIARENREDYYYDLSRTETDRLEYPFWYVPEEAGMTVGRAFSEMAGRLSGIIGGVQIFRPMVGTGIVREPFPSIRRGPSALVFDVNALRDFPNAAPMIGGRLVRRSDMTWSLLNRFVAGHQPLKSDLPIRQDRALNIGRDAIDFDSLIDDIRGYAFYSCLEDVLSAKSERRQAEGRPAYGPGILEFDEFDVDLVARMFREHIQDRLTNFRLNVLRIRGLLASFQRYLDGDAHPSPWWLRDDRYAGAASDLRHAIGRLRHIYAGFDMMEFRRRVESAGTGEVSEYMTELLSLVNAHRDSTPLPVSTVESGARTFIENEFGVRDLRCLGIGEEGVVLTDGRRTYKYFHYWKARDRERDIEFLRSLVGRLDSYPTLPSISGLTRRGDEVVITYNHVEGTAYRNGSLHDLLGFLRDCRDAGIVCLNAHPDNFVQTDDGVMLVDIGSDVRPYTDKDFLSMCRKVFLMHRFPFRTDLKRLMRESWEIEDIPEMFGFEHFLRALDPRSKEEILDPLLVKLALEECPDRVLDYGCGKGRIAESLAERGVSVVAYDPDPAVIERCRSYGSSVDYVDRPPSQGECDVAICSLVLCALEYQNAFDEALRDLRSLVSDDGTAIVAVCNPFHSFVSRSEIGEAMDVRGHRYDETFTRRKRVASTGAIRQDVHRPIEEYRRSFLKAGFVIRDIHETDGTDILELRPSSDFLVFRLKPVPTAESYPRVSLLIKTCYMEWKIIEKFVRHQVGQLEGPRAFFEKVVVVDTRSDGFSRQYEVPNPEAHTAAMNRLIEDGVVDRVVYAPQDSGIIRATYKRWFGVESVESHAHNGQQTFATLFGFDQCGGDYVFQLDSDILIGRKDDNHDYLGDMLNVFEKDPGTLFVPLSIPTDEPFGYSSEGPSGDWRVEVRICLFDRERIARVLPVTNAVSETIESGQVRERLDLPWHRAFDRLIRDSDYRSYRGGNPDTFFLHVPNDIKNNLEELYGVMDSVQRGYVPDCQKGAVGLRGGIEDWSGPKRAEPYVFIVCGRNVTPGRFKQCFESLVGQSIGNRGAVLVDDASSNGLGDYMLALSNREPYAHRITLVRNYTRQGLLRNTWEAITRHCSDPESVIITLDADDALIGPHVLSWVAREFENGADVTVGSMLRLDKEATYVPTFNDPRGNRGGNVWQHLRAFKKRLFDAIDVEDLKLDGAWIEYANDWAYMLPIVEMAESPAYIPDILYLHEPSGPRDGYHKTERDRVISALARRPRYSRASLPTDE